MSIDPTSPNLVWVGSGENNNQRAANYGDGIYKSKDGGKSWKNVGLKTSEHIGMITIDPTNSDVVYVAVYGPLWSSGGERGIYKTTDGGTTWNKLTRGFPTSDVGRIGIDISPVNPDVLYAVIEAAEEAGTYRSTDRGASWSKMSNYTTSGNYYQELFCDPKDVNKIYIADTYFMMSEDGGKTMKHLGEIHKHGDNHVLDSTPTIPAR